MALSMMRGRSSRSACRCQKRSRRAVLESVRQDEDGLTGRQRNRPGASCPAKALVCCASKAYHWFNQSGVRRLDPWGFLDARKEADDRPATKDTRHRAGTC